MSLTEMLSSNRRFNELIKQLMPSPKIFISNTENPPFSRKNPMVVPYTLEENEQASLLGTASDYMFRFLISKHVTNNKDGVLEDLVAEKGLDRLIDFSYKRSNLAKESEENNRMVKCLDGIKKDFVKSKNTIKRFIYGEEGGFDSIICISVWFAQLEHYFRSGGSSKKAKVVMNKEKEPRVERELKQLCDVFMNTFIESKIITSDSDVIYNPHFGEWSKKVGGADADIYIDGILYDFKCTKYVDKKSYEYCAQVYAYFLLYLLDKQNECIGSLADKEIKGIALYYSRQGLINTCYLSENDFRYDYSANSLNKVSEMINEVYESYYKCMQSDDIMFNQFLYDYIDREIFGSYTVEEYLSKAFPSYKGDDVEYIKEKPIFWSGNYIPEIIEKKDFFYVIRISSCFDIKKGKIPFVYSRGNYYYPNNEPLSSSDVYFLKEKKYYRYYKTTEGKIEIFHAILTLTKTDYLKFLTDYEVHDLEILDGCYFEW